MTFTVHIKDFSNGALPATVYRMGQLPNGKTERRHFANVRTEKQKHKQAHIDQGLLEDGWTLQPLRETP